MYNIYAILNGGTSSADPTFNYVNEDVLDQIGTVITKILSWCTSNSLLAIFLTLSMLGVGFCVIGWIKGVIRLK